MDWAEPGRAPRRQGAMPNMAKPRAAGEVATAMNRVLTAEREALAELEACRAEAERTLEAARREARAILERAERTARDIHGRTERLAAARAQQLIDAATGQPREPLSPQSMSAAVDRLAARMTGGAADA